jgi:hypothetical protein
MIAFVGFIVEVGQDLRVLIISLSVRVLEILLQSVRQLVRLSKNSQQWISILAYRSIRAPKLGEEAVRLYIGQVLPGGESSDSSIS